MPPCRAERTFSIPRSLHVRVCGWLGISTFSGATGSGLGRIVVSIKRCGRFDRSSILRLTSLLFFSHFFPWSDGALGARTLGRARCQPRPPRPPPRAHSFAYRFGLPARRAGAYVRAAVGRNTTVRVPDVGVVAGRRLVVRAARVAHQHAAGRRRRRGRRGRHLRVLVHTRGSLGGRRRRWKQKRVFTGRGQCVYPTPPPTPTLAAASAGQGVRREGAS